MERLSLVQYHNHPIHVYIVEDDASVRKGLARLMRSLGIESSLYDSAESFLEHEPSEENPCILLDITMPKMNGLELAEKLKVMGCTYPIIAVSARDDDEVRDQVEKMGACFFLRKPVDDQALIDAIKWVTRKGSQQE